MAISRELIEDVAVELGINEPALVEKDYYVVQALSLLSSYQSPYFELVFAGGSCLSKVLTSLQRMSEDVDIKVLLTEAGAGLSRNELRNKLREFKGKLNSIFESGCFTVDNASALNEHRYINYQLSYPRIFDVVDALRPTIKMEFTLCESTCGRYNKQISSMVNQVTGETPEIDGFLCVAVQQTAAEKLVALLRRTAAGLRGINDWCDETLIRHLYDLHIINRELSVDSSFVNQVKKAVIADGEQYRDKHPQFLSEPEAELAAALKQLKDNQGYNVQYEKFLVPLVYAKEKPSYEAVLETLYCLARKVWGDGVGV